MSDAPKRPVSLPSRPPFAGYMQSSIPHVVAQKRPSSTPNSENLIRRSSSASLGQQLETIDSIRSRSRSHILSGSSLMGTVSSAQSGVPRPSSVSAPTSTRSSSPNGRDDRSARFSDRGRQQTFYELFKTEFPSMVRENVDTVKRLSEVMSHEALDALNQQSNKTSDLKSYELVEKRPTYQDAEEQELRDELVDIEHEMEQLLLRKEQIVKRLEDKKLADRNSSNQLSDSESENDFVDEVMNTENNSFAAHTFAETCVKTLSGHSAPVTCVDFVDPIGLLLSGSEDGSLRLWDMAGWRQLKILRHHDAPVRCIQYDGSIAASGGDDCCVRLWRIPALDNSSLSHFENLEDEAWVHATLCGHAGPVRCLQFDYGLARLLSGSVDGFVKVWDLNTQKVVLNLNQNLSQASEPTPSSTPPSSPLLLDDLITSRGVGALQFYQHAVATGHSDGMIRLYDIRSGQTSVQMSPSKTNLHPIRTLAGHTLPITTLQFDDVNVISGSLDRVIRVWDLRNGKSTEGYVSKAQTGIASLQFDKEKIVAAAGDASVMVVDRYTKEQKMLSGHKAIVRTVRFHESRLVTGGDDCVLKLWDISK